MNDVYLFRIAFAAAGMARGLTSEQTQSAYSWLGSTPGPDSVREAYEMMDLAFRVVQGD